MANNRQVKYRRLRTERTNEGLCVQFFPSQTVTVYCNQERIAKWRHENWHTEERMVGRVKRLMRKHAVRDFYFIVMNLEDDDQWEVARLACPTLFEFRETERRKTSERRMRDFISPETLELSDWTSFLLLAETEGEIVDLGYYVDPPHHTLRLDYSEERSGEMLVETEDGGIEIIEAKEPIPQTRWHYAHHDQDFVPNKGRLRGTKNKKMRKGGHLSPGRRRARTFTPEQLEMERQISANAREIMDDTRALARQMLKDIRDE